MTIDIRYAPQPTAAELAEKERLAKLAERKMKDGVDGEAGEKGEKGVDLTVLPPFSIDSEVGVVPELSPVDGTQFRVMLQSNWEVTFATSWPNGARFTVALTQNSEAPWVVTWPLAIRWAEGAEPVLSVDAHKRDLIMFERWPGTTEDGDPRFDAWVVGMGF